MSDKKKVHVSVAGRGSFEGTVIDETNSHFKVTHENNKDHGEWFAKKSDMVNCVVIRS